MTSQPQTVHEERHASWAELFFDLVVVAGIGLFGHLLHHPSVPVLALSAIGFGALWTCWIAFMLYGNASGDRTRTNRLLQGMFGMAVMAAAVPGLAESLAGHGSEGAEHHRSIESVVFAVAYVVTRLRGAGAWRRGEVLREWPVAQHITGTLPWIISIWAPVSWTLWLWALGLLIDAVTILVFSGDDAMREAEQRADRVRQRAAEHPRGKRPQHPGRAGDDGDALVSISPVALEPGHLSERLSLFVIIVLGEGIIQSINSAAGAEWDWALFGTGAAALVLIGGLWGLSVEHGHAGVPLLRAGQLSPRVEIAFHGVASATLVVIAVGVGALVDNGGSVPEASARWLLCGGLAGYFGLGLIAALLSSRRGAVRLVLWGATGVVVPLALAYFGADFRGIALAWYAALVVVLHTWFGQKPDHRQDD